MKSTIATLMFLATQLGLAPHLMAASAVREDASMLLIWLFLGMCALIVIVQLLPAMFLTFGMLKSFYRGEKTQASANVSRDE